MLHLLGTFFLLALHVHSLRASSPIVVSKASREGTRERVSGGCTCVSFRVFVCNSYVTSGEKSSLARFLSRLASLEQIGELAHRLACRLTLTGP